METEDLLVIIKSNEASAGGTSDLVWQGKKVRSQEFNISQNLGTSYQVAKVCRYIPQGLVHSSTCFSVNSSVCAASGAHLAEVGH